MNTQIDKNRKTKSIIIFLGMFLILAGGAGLAGIRFGDGVVAPVTLFLFALCFSVIAAWSRKNQWAIIPAGFFASLGLAARFILLGLGFGLFQAPNLSEILRGVKPSLVGLAASTNAVLKNLGALSGITLMVTVFAWMDLHRVSLREEVYLGIGPFHRAFAAADRTSSRFRLAIAFSTLPQLVFWVRIAPTHTSKGVSAGHQWSGP